MEFLFLLVVFLGFALYFHFRLSALERRSFQSQTKQEKPVARESAPREHVTTHEPAPKPVQKSHTPPTPKSEFKIGARFYTIVGGLAVLLGLGFLLRYSIENDLISPAFRVLLGVVFGLVLLGLGEWLKTKYRTYSHVLSGTGLGALYVSLYAASQLYQLLSLEIAFIAMVCVTGLGLYLALRADSQPLAVLAQIGGFLTPLILSSGENRPHVLFPYLLILNAVFLILAWKKPWRWPVAVALIGTVLVYLGWYDAYPTTDWQTPVAYLSLFFLQFLGRTLYRAWTNAKADETDLSLLFTVPMLYAFAALPVLDVAGRDHQAGFAFLLALLYLALAAARYAVLKKSEIYDLAFTAIGATFLAIAFPIYFTELRYVIVGWSLEALAMRFISDRAKSKHLTVVSYVLFSLAAIMMLSVYGEGSDLIGYLDPRVVTYVLGLIPLLGWIGWNEWRLYSSKSKREVGDSYLLGIGYVLVLWFVVRQLGELANEAILNQFLSVIGATTVATAAYWLGVKGRSGVLRIAAHITVAFAVVHALDLTTRLPDDAWSVFNPRFAAFIVFAIGAWLAHHWLSKSSIDASEKNLMLPTLWTSIHPLVLWAVGAEIVDYYSGNLQNALITVSWLVYAIGLTMYGIWKKSKLARYTAGALFLLTTLKIVVVDTAELDNFYRFVVFISLGILLLVAGYLYNRFKAKIEA